MQVAISVAVCILNSFNHLFVSVTMPVVLGPSFIRVGFCFYQTREAGANPAGSTGIRMGNEAKFHDMMKQWRRRKN